MTRMTNTILFLLLAAVTASAQQNTVKMKSMIGTDIASAVKSGRLKIFYSHQICSRWSAGGWAAFRPDIGRADAEEDEHRSEFSDSTMDDIPEDIRWKKVGLDFRFWPSEAYDGAFISTGAAVDEEGNGDISLGIGYNMKIWKGMTVNVHFEMNVTDSFITQEFKGEGSGLCICLVF